MTTTQPMVFTMPYEIVPPTAVAGLRKKIENYSFVPGESIGKGYSSTVYKGKDDRTGEDVAIKVVDLSSLKDATSKQLLATEIECLRESNHGNVLRYFDSFFTKNNCYIVTEYCSGGDLQTQLKKQSHTQQAAKALFKQILDGYGHFSRVGFVHRDLKPANIFVGKYGQLRIGDFGFSKRKGGSEKQIYNVGTPIYMPLQSLTANIYNEKTDTWALAISLYEIVYGQVPFRGASQHDLRAKITNGITVFPEKPLTSEHFKDFIRRSLKNDAGQRMGLRQMQNHPWVTGIQHTLHVKSERELSLKTSFINRSKEMSQQRLVKRGGQSLQRLKLHQNKRGVLDRSQQKIKATQPQKEIKKTGKQNSQGRLGTVQTAVSSRKSVMLGGKNRNGQANRRKNTQIKIEDSSNRIVCLMNYFRLLYSIRQRVTVTMSLAEQQQQTSLQEVAQELEKQLISVFGLHLQAASTGQNVFKLEEAYWNQLKEGKQWKRYTFVIDQYNRRYSSILKLTPNSADFSPCTPSSDGLNSSLAQMLSHHSSVNTLIQRQGWQFFSKSFPDPRMVTGQVKWTLVSVPSSQQQVRRM